jgi:GTP cyclohydrolase I
MPITHGWHQDPAAPLQKTFPCEPNAFVLIKNSPFHSLCEHQLLPLYGVAHVADRP